MSLFFATTSPSAKHIPQAKASSDRSACLKNCAFTSALVAFNDNLHSFEVYNIGNLSYFKNTISELKGAMLSGPIRNINGKKDFQKIIDKLILELHFFEINEPSKFKAQLKIVAATIAELKKLVEAKV